MYIVYWLSYGHSSFLITDRRLDFPLFATVLYMCKCMYLWLTEQGVGVGGGGGGGKWKKPQITWFQNNSQSHHLRNFDACN